MAGRSDGGGDIGPTSQCFSPGGLLLYRFGLRAESFKGQGGVASAMSLQLDLQWAFP